MKIAILCDTHLGIRNSSQIFLNNSHDFYSKVFFPACEERNINHILHLGDYYDNRKNVNIKALNHNRYNFLNEMRKRKMTMDIIPGNHDTFFKNTNDINSLKELLGYYTDEVKIIMKPMVKQYGSLKMALLPWLCSDNYDESIKFINECDADWLGAHLELNGFELMRGVNHTHGMNHKLFKKFEKVLTGHFHVASQKDNIMYLGSQMEFFWSDAHDKKYLHILDTETRELEKIYNPYTLFYKLEYNDRENDYMNFDVSKLKNKFVKIIVKEKTNTLIFDRLIDRIQNEETYDLKILENFSEFMGENVSDENLKIEDTNKLVGNYIDEIDTDLDKNKIKYMMKELMNHAQTLEVF